MTFEEAMREAAKQADRGVSVAMRQYRQGVVTDEDDLTGVLVGALAAQFNNQKIGGLSWSASIARHRRGEAAEEKRIGADLLIHVTLATPSRRYSKGVLVQAKRVEPIQIMRPRDFDGLKDQCRKMLEITPAAFVFDYTRSGMRCGSATRIEGSEELDLHAQCSWTSYRFFRELFRCSIGDPRITSAKVSDLPLERELTLKATGALDSAAKALR